MRKAPFAGTSKSQHAAFAKIVRSLTYRHEPWRIFADFCELAACSIHNSITPSTEREERYRAIAGRYDAKELGEFPKLLAHTIQGLEDFDSDFLGECFMQMELSNHWQGQFFTPFDLCRAIAEMTAPQADDPALNGQGFVTVLDPAVGAGALLLAFAVTLRDRGVDFQHRMHATAIDIDRTAAMMSYIQLSLWHIPALVCIGDGLWPQKGYEVWATPAHRLGFWDARLRRRFEERPAAALPVDPAADVTLRFIGQAPLFDLGERRAS